MAVNPPIGQLRTLGTFSINQAPIVKTAGYLDGYTTVVAKVFCKLKKINSVKDNEFGEVAIRSNWLMWCRWSPDVKFNIDNTTMFGAEGILYRVDGFELIDHRNFYYKFWLTEKLKTNG